LKSQPKIELCKKIQQTDNFLKGLSALSNSPDQRAAGRLKIDQNEKYMNQSSSAKRFNLPRFLKLAAGGIKETSQKNQHFAFRKG
jgi:hypothetical protein